MDWTPVLQPGESLRWEGRPAPTCFCFRNWRHSFYGSLLLVFSVYWLVIGVPLRAVFGHWLLGWAPAPFVLVGLYLSIGHLVHARLEWEKVFYAVTDRRILVRRGFFRPRLQSLPLRELTGFAFQPLGADLGSFRLTGSHSPRALALTCIDHPGRLTSLLELTLAANQQLVSRLAGPVH
ncbi:MAG: PH domain-containing protein [Desulfuromonadales bacterium]|nr:PH domain-containing protein [Desulfuromonadales bacterium]